MIRKLTTGQLIAEEDAITRAIEEYFKANGELAAQPARALSEIKECCGTLRVFLNNCNGSLGSVDLTFPGSERHEVTLAEIEREDGIETRILEDFELSLATHLAYFYEFDGATYAAIYKRSAPDTVVASCRLYRENAGIEWYTVNANEVEFQLEELKFEDRLTGEKLLKTRFDRLNMRVRRRLWQLSEDMKEVERLLKLRGDEDPAPNAWKTAS